MSNTEADPAALACGDRPAAADPDRPDVEILTPRDVPLGGPRAMRVRRTLPQRARSLIGAWCFADHYGPHEVTAPGAMDVAPHPHTGLQTVSWLFAGEIEHRDSLGTHATVRPGELNLMTGGHGICHSEVSTAAAKTLHGVQLWVALPERHRHTARAFDHYVPSVNRIDGAEIRVFLGSLAGRTSPIPTFTPLLGAELVLGPDAHMSLGIDPRFEHGVLVDTGDVVVAGTRVRAAELGYVGTGLRSLTLSNRGSDAGAVPAARRDPVRRRDPDVVELRRPDPRGDRGLPRSLAGGVRPVRRGHRLHGHPATAAGAGVARGPHQAAPQPGFRPGTPPRLRRIRSRRPARGSAQRRTWRPHGRPGRARRSPRPPPG